MACLRHILLLKLLHLSSAMIGSLVAQDTSINKYGLSTVDSAAYVKMLGEQPGQELVDIRKYIPSVICDIRYASANNFMKKKMYPSAGAYMRRDAADSLRVIQQELNKKGYGLKLFDAYRPYHITVAFYEHYRDTTYVASPYTGSRHNRGCAVDVTMIELKTGREVEMPTSYDDFSPRSHSSSRDAPARAERNRRMLQKAMTAHGFEIFPAEWWHFDFVHWRNYPVMNVSFSQLELLNKEE